MDTEFEERTEELLRESKKADAEDKLLVENMRRLMASHDFDMYCRRVLGPRIDEFGASLLQPSGSHDGMVKSEFMKGAIYGLCLARDLPQVIINATRTQETPSDE